jgi:hypothetical protein
MVLMAEWYTPCDPECPEYREFADSLFNDPMTAAMGAPTDEIMRDFERRHRIKCDRCQDYGINNIDVR